MRERLDPRFRGGRERLGPRFREGDRGEGGWRHCGAHGVVPVQTGIVVGAMEPPLARG